MGHMNIDTVMQGLLDSKNCIMTSLCDRALLDSTVAAAEIMTQALRRGNKIMLIGNGGSAADAQHIAAELIGRFKMDRGPLAAIALTSDTAVLTALANDFGYEEIFARQVRGLGTAGDVLIGVSTSGKSENVLQAMTIAKEMQMHTICMTGSLGSELSQISNVAMMVPDDRTALIQQIHITLAHIICDMIENELVDK
jgi:D-sedoheptulose 7-phosphate isomerase